MKCGRKICPIAVRNGRDILILRRCNKCNKWKTLQEFEEIKVSGDKFYRRTCNECYPKYRKNQLKEWSKRMDVRKHNSYKRKRHYSIGHSKNMYGYETIIDLRGCAVGLFNRTFLKLLCTELCKLLGAKQEKLVFWDDKNVPEAEKLKDPKTKGTTCIQFLLKSNITIHTLDLLGAVYINVFYCDSYDPAEVYEYCLKMFEATPGKSKFEVVERW